MGSYTPKPSILNVDASDVNEDNARWLRDYWERPCVNRECDKAESNPSIKASMKPPTDAADSEKWVLTGKVLCLQAITSNPSFALVKRDSQMRLRPPIGAVAVLGFFNSDFTIMLLLGDETSWHRTCSCPGICVIVHLAT